MFDSQMAGKCSKTRWSPEYGRNCPYLPSLLVTIDVLQRRTLIRLLTLSLCPHLPTTPNSHLRPCEATVVEGVGTKCDLIASFLLVALSASCFSSCVVLASGCSFPIDHSHHTNSHHRKVTTHRHTKGKNIPTAPSPEYSVPRGEHRIKQLVGSQTGEINRRQMHEYFRIVSCITSSTTDYRNDAKHSILRVSVGAAVSTQWEMQDDEFLTTRYTVYCVPNEGTFHPSQSFSITKRVFPAQSPTTHILAAPALAVVCDYSLPSVDGLFSLCLFSQCGVW